LLGVLSNLGGLLYMLSCYRDARQKTGGFLDFALRWPLKEWLPLYVVAAAALFVAYTASLWYRSVV